MRRMVVVAATAAASLAAAQAPGADGQVAATAAASLAAAQAPGADGQGAVSITMSGDGRAVVVGAPGSPPQILQFRPAAGGGGSGGAWLPFPAETEKAAYLGVSTSPAGETVGRQLGLPRGVGLTVDYVDPQSPAAGSLQVHDVLHKLEDQLLVNHEQLAVLLRMRKPGDAVELTAIRTAKPVTVKVTLGEKELPKLGARPADPFRGHVPAFQGMGTNFNEFLQTWMKGTPSRWMPQAYTNLFRLQAPTNIQQHFRLHTTPGGGSSRTSVRTSTGGGGAMSSFSFGDEHGSLTLTQDGAGRKTLLAADPTGKVLFNGSIDTEDQRKAVPAAFLRGLKEVEDMAGGLEREVEAGDGQAPEPSAL